MVMNQSIPAMQETKSSMKAVKVKPRDFKANPKLLTELGAAGYDQIDEKTSAIPDLSELEISLENKIEKLRVQWKCQDVEKLKMLIRKQVIMELTRIEERKKVRIDRIELKAKRKAQEEDDNEAEETGIMNKSTGSPQKGMSVAFQDKSSISSPTKASPKKSFAFSESATDMMSVSMASKASPMKGGFLQMMLGGGQGIKGILSNAGPAVTSGLTVGSKALQKLDRGGVAAGTKSIAGRSVGSRGTRRTGTMSRAGSRKSKADNEIADMEIEEIEAIIDEKVREMNVLNKEMSKIQRAKAMNQGAKDTKMKPLKEALD